MRNGLQATTYQFYFWQRIFQPLSSMVMIFLAIPFVLGGLHRMLLGMRLMAAIFVGFVFFILNATLSELSIVYQVSPIIAAALPPVCFAAAGLWLSRQVIIK
jgi:lipopolysaccharide export system permease protein